jgi:predicted ArsR family transcriptional regulator
MQEAEAWSRKFPSRVGEIMKAVLTELRQAGGDAKLKDLLERAKAKLHPTDYERERCAEVESTRRRQGS